MLNTNKVLFEHNYKLFVILAAGSLTPMAGGLVAPIIPDLISQLELDPVLAGNLVSVHCLTIALFSPFLGILADKTSPIKVLIPSLVAYSLFGMAGGFLGDFWSLLTTRALLGVASGGIAAASLGLLSKMYEGDERTKAIGYATATLTITGMIFPLLGGWVGTNHWQYTFYLYAFGLPIALFAVLCFGNTPSQAGKGSSVAIGKYIGKVLTHPIILRLLITLALASAIMYGLVIYTPMYLKATFASTATLNGLVLALQALGAATISAFGSKPIAKHFGLQGSIALGFGLMALALIMIPMMPQFQLILAVAVCFGCGFGLALPSLYSALASIAPSKLRSSVLATGTGAGFLGQFISPLLLGPVLAVGNFSTVFYSAAVVAMLAGLLAFVPAAKLK